jgi:PAS domain S-box-containing protein
MPPGLPTIVVVDDAAEVRLLVRTRLRMSARLEVVGEASDGAEAVAQARKHQPSLMLLDVSMPVMDGLTALPEVLAVSPATRVVLYSGFEEQGLVDQARALGASAFVEKSVPVESLADLLLEVLAPPPVERPEGSSDQPSPIGDQAVLGEHLERFREVFDEAAIGMATLTLSGTLVRVNRALARLVGGELTQLVGRSYGELWDRGSDDLTTALQEIQRSPVDVVHLEHGVAGRGKTRLRAILAPVRDSRGRPLYLFLQVEDVTKERAALEALRTSEERFRLLVEVVQDYAIFMLDPDGRIASWNLGAERSKGYTADEIIGQHFRIFYPAERQAEKHPEHELELALRDGQYAEEGWRVRKDGSVFWASVVITAVHDEIGRHVGFAKVTRDNTARRRLEQEREQALAALASANTELASLNSRLQRAAEDQAQFLAVTAHELRTPIGVLSGSAELLAQHWTELDDEERDELVRAVGTSTVRLRRLLDDLLTASRLQASALELRLEPVSLRAVVASAVTTARRAWPDADLVVDVPVDVAVRGDQDRLSQALENLIGNALLHGVPPVRVDVVRAGDRAELRVSDQGVGVAAQVRGRLFERFATGLSKGGTGLGLFIVRELARAHGGEASYEAPSNGASAGTFVICLPVAERQGVE